jgi:hypothetical protein
MPGSMDWIRNSSNARDGTAAMVGLGDRRARGCRPDFIEGRWVLPRPTGTRSARTAQAAPGLLVDYTADGKPIGLEITAPAQVTLEQVNQVLAGLGLAGVSPEELAPLRAA